MADQSGAPPKPRIIEVGISVYLPKNTLFSIAVAISIIIHLPKDPAAKIDIKEIDLSFL